jgi:hypothetical protein
MPSVEPRTPQESARRLNYTTSMEGEQRDIMPLISSAGPTRDKEYYFEDGSCIFLVENVLFNVRVDLTPDLNVGRLIWECALCRCIARC